MGVQKSNLERTLAIVREGEWEPLDGGFDAPMVGVDVYWAWDDENGGRWDFGQLATRREKSIWLTVFTKAVGVGWSRYKKNVLEIIVAAMHSLIPQIRRRGPSCATPSSGSHNSLDYFDAQYYRKPIFPSCASDPNGQKWIVEFMDLAKDLK